MTDTWIIKYTSKFCVRQFILVNLTGLLHLYLIYLCCWHSVGWLSSSISASSNGHLESKSASQLHRPFLYRIVECSMSSPDIHVQLSNIVFVLDWIFLKHIWLPSDLPVCFASERHPYLFQMHKLKDPTWAHHPGNSKIPVDLLAAFSIR